jgi:HEAT repeat protein
MGNERPMQVPNRWSIVVLLLSVAATATAQSTDRKSPDNALIRGKSLDAWISQSTEAATLEDRHNALQVLRNDGVRRNREKTLRAFADALSAKDPTVQSLAAAGLRKAGRPTDPIALSRLVKIVSKDLSAAKPSLESTGENHIQFGLATRVIRALEEVGDERQVAPLQRIAENNRVHPILRQYATKAIRQIKSRPNDTDLKSRSRQGNSQSGK